MTIGQDVHGQPVTSRLHAAKRKTLNISEQCWASLIGGAE